MKIQLFLASVILGLLIGIDNFAVEPAGFFINFPANPQAEEAEGGLTFPSPELREGEPAQHASIASWYDYSLPGNFVYSRENLTCASRDYPRGTLLKVSYQGKSVICRVNDYGPEEDTGRAIDLSSLAFSKLAPLSRGLIEVSEIKILN